MYIYIYVTYTYIYITSNYIYLVVVLIYPDEKDGVHFSEDKENPLAPVLFQQVSKAYSALTDEAARKNYEKYGNPDGPVQMKAP